MAPRDPFSKSALFERALRGILRPLVRALIAQGVTAPALYRVLKQTYVEVASDTLGVKATDSRITVMTGVHRRDVKDFRTQDKADEDQVGKRVSTLSTVIGRWLSFDDLTDDQGAPLPLPRSGEETPNFESLVQSVSRDIRPRTVLDELIRQDIVHLRDDLIHLSLEGLVGPANIEQRLHFFSHNLGDHMSAAVENLLRDDPPFLERAVFYNCLLPDSVDQIEQEARKLSHQTLLKLNKQASALQDSDKTHAAASNRFRFGVFFYKDDEGPGDKGQDTP